MLRMKRLETVKLNLDECENGLRAFRSLLDSGSDLSETQDILPLFHQYVHMSGLIAFAQNVDVIGPDFSYAFEYPLFGDFALDLIVGDREQKAYCFIEFEDAKSDSLFQGEGRAVKYWGSRFLKGYSQLMDWSWKKNEMLHTQAFQRQFGEPYPHIIGILVVGRTREVGSEERSRLEWLQNHVSLDGQKIVCLTFDDLYRALASRLETSKQWARHWIHQGQP
jgi:hypothetical protein